jgi:DNA-binding LacI/PurR family transcriptional regulator
MADVAQLSGVSTQTVSRYFTGAGYVGAQTRDRIRAAVEQLDYRPNRSARNLRVRRSDTIGVLAVGPLNYGLATTLAGLSDAARLADFPLVIAHLDVDSRRSTASAEIRTAVDFFVSAPMDGIIVTSPYLGTEHLLDHVRDAIPMVTVSGRPLESADSVTTDSYAAGVEATRHLLDLGHTAVLHLAGPADRNEAHDRARGYHDALAQAGLEPLPLTRGDWSAASGHAAGSAVDVTSFTAVFSGNDQMALGFMSAMRARGLLAPRDYAIIGVDDMPDAGYFDPPLSSMFMDFRRVGTEAFRMIHHRIHTGERLDMLVIDPVLVPRASSAAPR